MCGELDCKILFLHTAVEKHHEFNRVIAPRMHIGGADNPTACYASAIEHAEVQNSTCIRPTRLKFNVARLPQLPNVPQSRFRVARFMHRANSRGARDGFGSCFKIRGIWGWRFSHGKYTGRVRVAEVGTGTIAAYRTLI